MIFKKLNLKSETKAINDFLNQIESCKSTTILGYHYPFYGLMLDSIGVGQPLYFGGYIGNKIVAYLPGFIRKTKIGSVYSSLPFFGPNVGAVLENKYSSKKNYELLLKKLIEYLKSQRGIISASFYTGFLSKDFSFFEKSLKTKLYVDKFTQYLDLSKSKWNAELLYDIRKAKKNNVKIETKINEKRIDDFYKIYKKNCDEFGIPLKPKKSIEFLLHQGVSLGQVKCYFAYVKNMMIGGLIVIYGKEVVSYYLPCTLSSARTLQSNTLLIDFAIEEAKNNDKKIWNWESSPSQDSGVYRFKKKWGSLESKYRTYIKTFTPEEKIREYGNNTLVKNFPYFYVIPFKN